MLDASDDNRLALQGWEPSREIGSELGNASTAGGGGSTLAATAGKPRRRRGRRGYGRARGVVTPTLDRRAGTGVDRRAGTGVDRRVRVKGVIAAKAFDLPMSLHSSRSL